jgi:hypothetical protein
MLKVCLALVLFTGPALAKKANPPDAPPKTQRFDFDEDEVVGGLDGPTQELIGGRIGVRHSSLIRVRTDFRPELIRTADDI